MKTIKEIVPKYSDAVMAIVDGLLEASKQPNFIIDMCAFGAVEDESGFCMGCAATCAIQKIFNVKFTSENIFPSRKRASAAGGHSGITILLSDFIHFEECVDCFRVGSTHWLQDYYGISYGNDIRMWAPDIIGLHGRLTKDNSEFKLFIEQATDHANYFKQLDL